MRRASRADLVAQSPATGADYLKLNLEVEFSLKGKTNPIGVAEYTLSKALPSDLVGKLPSPSDLQRAIGSVLSQRASDQ